MTFLQSYEKKSTWQRKQVFFFILGQQLGSTTTFIQSLITPKEGKADDTITTRKNNMDEDELEGLLQPMENEDELDKILDKDDID